MNPLRFNEKTLWRLTHLIFLTCIGLFGASRFLGIPSLKPVHFFTALSVIILLVLPGYRNLHVRLMSIAGIFLALSGAGIFIGFRNILFFFQSYFHWLAGRAQWTPKLLPVYEIIQVVFLVLFCFVLQIFMEKEPRLKAAVLLTLLAVLLYHLFAEKEIPRISVAFVLCYASMIYAEWTQLHWKKEKQRGTSSYMLWIMPFLAVYFLLTLMPPAPKTPYDWQFVKNACRQLKESFLKLSYNLGGIGGDDYDLSLSGFSERGRLGNGSKENNREIMTLQSKTKLATNLYLTGKIYDTFDGREWHQNNRDSYMGRYMDTLATLYAIQRYDEDYLSDYLYLTELTVSYRYFRSEFLFAPLKTMQLKQNYSGMRFENSGDTLLFDSRKGYGTEYDVSFYQLNAGQENFLQFLNEAPGLAPDENGLTKILMNFENRTRENVTSEDLRQYGQSVHKYYTENITLSERTREYLREITEGAVTDMDKLKAIESELSSFTYTRTPGSLPETVKSPSDFLDYFLLESREGYCNYFATAFTLLARAQGFPARFVQGFCVPSKGKNEVMVYSNMAHAWPEVYIENVGWVPFEPTPGYSRIRYASWAARNKNADVFSNSNALPPKANTPEKSALALPESDMEEIQKVVPSHGKIHFRRIFTVCVLIFALVLGAAILLFLVNILLLRHRYRKMSLKDKFRAEVCRNLRILSFLGVKRDERETLTEFKERALALTGVNSCLEFLERYEDVLYGDKEVAQETLEKALREQTELLLMLKQRKRWAYIYCRICG